MKAQGWAWLSLVRAPFEAVPEPLLEWASVSQAVALNPHPIHEARRFSLWTRLSSRYRLRGQDA